MLNLSNLKPKIKKKPRKRVGRGLGSGSGTYSGRGIKGQKARTGGSIRPGFEGGRMPFIRQIPKARGFKSIHQKPATLDLQKVAAAFASESLVSPRELLARGFIESAKQPVKIVGKNADEKKLTFQNLALSAGAKAAIEAAGGKIIDAK